MRTFLHRPSPAMIVALIALAVALSGTSYAAFKLKRNAVKARNIAPNAVSSPKVKDRSLLAIDFKADQLPQGAKGDKGDPGAARAYATVASNGTLNTDRSSNVTSASRGDTGVYCLTLGFLPDVAIASPFEAAANATAQTRILAPYGSSAYCPTATAEVRTYVGATLTDVPIFVIFE